MKKLTLFLFFIIALTASGCGSTTQTIVMIGNSMEPTIMDGDSLTIQKKSTYNQGDIVAFYDPNNENIILVKRIIGLPNEIIKLGGGDEKQLIFREKNNAINKEEILGIKKKANEALNKIKQGESFEKTGIEYSNKNPTKFTYYESEWKFKDEINEPIGEKLFTLQPNEFYDGTILTQGEYTITEDGQFVELVGLNLIKLLESQEVERKIEIGKKVGVSHILISYQGAERSEASRSKDEAYKLAREIREKAKNGENFEGLVKKYSDDFTSKEMNGELIAPAGAGSYVVEFESASLSLSEIGEISKLVESPFGYHIIKANSISPASEETHKEKQARFAKVFFSLVPDPWKDTELTIKHFDKAEVQFNEEYKPFISIEFNEEGGKLFEEITQRNIGKPLAIFVGGELISTPNVNSKISGGMAIIEGDFTLAEATNLAKDLNMGVLAYTKMATKLGYANEGMVIKINPTNEKFEVLEEKYLPKKMIGMTYPGGGLGIFNLEQNQYFLLGDNRIYESTHSMKYIVDKEKIIGVIAKEL